MTLIYVKSKKKFLKLSTLYTEYDVLCSLVNLDQIRYNIYFFRESIEYDVFDIIFYTINIPTETKE